MNRAFIIGRPMVDLSVIRQTVLATTGRDLTTNTKGPNEALSCLSLLIGGDEYGLNLHAKNMLDYTVMLLVDAWTMDNLQNFLHPYLSAYVLETKKPDVRLAFLKGSLFGFEMVVKLYSDKNQQIDILETLNSIQLAFENDGVGRIFNDFSKEKMGSAFWLEKKG